MRPHQRVDVAVAISIGEEVHIDRRAGGAVHRERKPADQDVSDALLVESRVNFDQDAAQIHVDHEGSFPRPPEASRRRMPDGNDRVERALPSVLGST